MHEYPAIRLIQSPPPRGEAARWIAFLDAQPTGNFFQSPAMFALYAGCRNYQPVAIFADDAHAEIVGVLLAIIVSDRIYGIPFQRILVHGGPVISAALEDKSPVLRALLKALLGQVSRKTVYLELRNLHPWGEEKHVFEEQGFVWHDHLNSILPAGSRDEVLAGIKPSKHRQILRGLENGAVIAPAASAGEVEALYRLLRELYRKKVRKPLPPLAFFANFYREIQSAGLGVILVVTYRDEVIGGMVCPFSGRETLHEWYIASVRDGQKNLYPGVLATWAGIDFAIGHNFSRFDFMGMGLPGKHYGTRDFKAQFGGTVVNFGRWQRVHNTMRFRMGLAGYWLLRGFRKGGFKI